jgi:serine/threonine protein phosphatase PrpC
MGYDLKQESIDAIKSLFELVKAVDELLDSESNEGCSDNLTVVSMAAIKKLKKLRGRK